MGEDRTTTAIQQPALPPGTRLGEIELKGVLGAGGFGIVYDAIDHGLNRRIAVKEYMPAFLAGRASDGQITLLSRSNAPTFDAGLRSFVEEARLLAGLDHPALVKVYQFWKANGTAYFTMPFYAGHTLTHHRRVLHTPFPEARLRALLEAMLGALEVLHRQHIVHRDVAPDNILLLDGGRPVLLDFGSARQTIEGQSRKLTAVVKLGYAPIEQYDDTRSGVQGPWTDLYALGATLRFLITGSAPPPAQMRALSDELKPLAAGGAEGVSRRLLRIVDWMLELRPADRPQDAAAVRAALTASASDDDDATISTTHVDLDLGESGAATDPVFESLAADRTRSWVPPARAEAGPPAARRRLAIGAVALVAAGAAAAVGWWQLRGEPPTRAAAAAPAAAASVAVSAPAAPVLPAAPDAAASAAEAASAPVAVPPPAAAPVAPAPLPAASAAAAPTATAAAPPPATPPRAAAAAPAAAPAATPPARTPPPPAAAPRAPPAEPPRAAAAEPQRLSPDMAAALARAQAGAAIIAAEQGKPPPPPREVPMPDPAEPPPAEAASAAPGGLASPLARCRNEVGAPARRRCLVEACASPELRFHAMCVRLQREFNERR